MDESSSLHDDDWDRIKANDSSDHGMNICEISGQEQDNHSDWTNANDSSDCEINFDEIFEQQHDNDSDWTNANDSSDCEINFDEIFEQQHDNDSDWTNANVSSDRGINFEEISDQQHDNDSDWTNANVSSDKQYKCTECGNEYKYLRNLKQHVIQKHPSKLLALSKAFTTNKPYKCDKCASQFSKIYSLKYHKRKVRGAVEHPQRIFQCNECPCKYSKEKYLRSHVKHKHAKSNLANQPEIAKNGNKCPLCACSLQENVILHFSSVHKINVDLQTFEFCSIQEFTAWKGKVEKETVAKYIKKRGSKDMDTYILHHYFCHRSGNFISESKGHRCLKTQGSNKIGGICPASMKINENKITGKCSVVFITTHVGHKNTLGHLFLSSEEREYLATKIASKVPFDAILDDVRDTMADQKLTRLHLLTKKDLHNIETSFNLSSIALIYLRFNGETEGVLQTICKNTEKSTLDEEKEKLKSTIMNLLTLADSLTTVEEVKILKKIVSANKPTFMSSCSMFG